jgi:thymidylate kinase
MKILIEGANATGKTALINRLFYKLVKYGETLVLKDPEFSDLGSLLSKTLKSNEYDLTSQLLLFTAVKIENKAKLEGQAPKFTLMDRGFLSTCAYQHDAIVKLFGEEDAYLKYLDFLNKVGGYIEPDLVIFITDSPDTILKRMIQRSRNDRAMKEVEIDLIQEKLNNALTTCLFEKPILFFSENTLDEMESNVLEYLRSRKELS